MTRANVEWTRTQCIRTTAELPIHADLIDERPYGQYIALARKVVHLTELGMTQVAIAASLGTSVRTVRRSIQWARDTCVDAS